MVKVSIIYPKFIKKAEADKLINKKAELEKGNF